MSDHTAGEEMLPHVRIMLRDSMTWGSVYVNAQDSFSCAEFQVTRKGTGLNFAIRPKEGKNNDFLQNQECSQDRVASRAEEALSALCLLDGVAPKPFLPA